MYLTREELLEIHNALALSQGDLYRKIDLALYPNKETIDAIKKEFPDAKDIWKDNTSNTYMVRFEDEDEWEDFEDSRICRANQIIIPKNIDVEIETIEISEEDWMYSGYDLVWKR